MRIGPPGPQEANRRLRAVGFLSILTGSLQAICAAIGVRSNEAAPVFLLIGGMMSVAFGAFGLAHLALISRTGKIYRRASPFLSLYWFYPAAGVSFEVLAVGTGLRRLTVVLAAALQTVALALLVAWWRAGLKRFGARGIT